MSEALTVKVSADASPFEAAVAEITELLTTVHLSDGVRERLDDLLGCIESPSEIFRIDPGTAVGANEVLFAFQPSDRLLDLLAALRALEGHNPAAIEREASHEQPPV